MSEKNQANSSLQDIQDIRRIMERSSRFISLSGLSGISAGLCALAGAALARFVIFDQYYTAYDDRGYFSGDHFAELKLQIMLLAGAVLIVAFLSAFYFTWRKSRKEGVSLWGHSSKLLFWNMVIPMAAGGSFILGMLQHNEWRFVAPSCLLFYGLSLVNASKFTLRDVRYLGYCEILLGLINMQWLHMGLLFWAIGFGLLHILYGIVMWMKYERVQKA